MTKNKMIFFGTRVVARKFGMEHGLCPPPGDRVRIVGWNCNNLGKYANQVKFLSKIRKMEGDISLYCVTLDLALLTRAPLEKFGEKRFFLTPTQEIGEV